VNPEIITARPEVEAATALTGRIEFVKRGLEIEGNLQLVNRSCGGIDARDHRTRTHADHFLAHVADAQGEVLGVALEGAECPVERFRRDASLLRCNAEAAQRVLRDAKFSTAILELNNSFGDGIKRADQRANGNADASRTQPETGKSRHNAAQLPANSADCRAEIFETPI